MASAGSKDLRGQIGLAGGGPMLWCLLSAPVPNLNCKVEAAPAPSIISWAGEVSHLSVVEGSKALLPVLPQMSASDAITCGANADAGRVHHSNAGIVE